MKYKAVLFDLDGTLLNTLGDLHLGVNLMLEKYDYPLRTVEEIRAFVGNGARELIRCALPEGVSEEKMETVLAEYLEWYAVNFCIKAAPYPGVKAVVDDLAAQGIKAAVVSNKPDATTKALAQMFFPGLPAFGQRDDTPKKPAPQMVWKAMEELGVTAEEAVYVGDSEVDVQTARNAGLPLVAVNWGFRTAEQLAEAGAETIVNTTEELLAAL